MVKQVQSCSVIRKRETTSSSLLPQFVPTKMKNKLPTLIVYREGDIVKQPMKKGSFVPKNVPGVGWGGVGGS